MTVSTDLAGTVVAGILGLTFVSSAGVAVYLVVRSYPKSRIAGIVGGALIVLVASAVGLVLFFVMPFSPVDIPLIVDEVSTRDGLKMMITQKFSGNAFEPYVVSFYYQGDSGEWYWYYLDHEALYWRRKIQLDEPKHSALITNYGHEVARFFWDTKKLERFNTTPVYVVDGPQALVHGHPLDPSHTKVDVTSLVSAPARESNDPP
jgi:hypothetical protein